jgi:hypothetical protein
MFEVDEYLRMAASNFKTAEAHLKDAEDGLHMLRERLENCLELMKKIPRDDLVFGEQLATPVPDSRPFDTRELRLVGS